VADVSNADFMQLRETLRAQGCFNTAPWRSLASLVVHVVISAALFTLSTQVAWWLAAPVFLLASLMFYRLGWIMHDAAHGGVFETARANRVLASVAAGVLGEFPSGWRWGHNRHHAAPNVKGKDLDQAERWDPSRRYHSLLTAAVGLLLFSRFKGVILPKTLFLLGLRDGVICYRYVRAAFVRELVASLLGLAAQTAGMVFLFGAWGAPLVLAHTVVGMLYLNTVFAGNHYDLPAFSVEEADKIDFAALQIRTTRNYPAGVVGRFIYGGLENQIEHHLFPAMPRHQLRRAAPAVQAYCAAHGLAYNTLPFTQSVMRVLRFHLVT